MSKSINGLLVQGALLQLDVVDSSNFITKKPDDGKEILYMLRNFIRDRIRSLYSGEEILWLGDGGIYLFREQRFIIPPGICALLAAIEIKRSMALFNNLLSPHPCHIELRLSIDFQHFVYHSDTSKIIDPRFSWFLKRERKIAIANSIYITEDLYSYINRYQCFCSKSHIVEIPKPSGNKSPVQIYAFDDDKSLGSERLFDILHQINKSDQSLYPYLEKHIPQIISTLESLCDKRRWRDTLSLREYLHRFFELTGKYHQGIEAGNLFMKAAEELEDTVAQCWIAIKDIGWLSLQLGENSESSRQIFKETLTKFEKIKCWEGMFYCCRYLGVYYYWNNKFSEAERHLKKAATYIPKCNNEIKERLISRLENNFGQYNLFLGKPNKAIPYFKRSLKRFQIINDTEKIAIVEINLGRAYSMLKQDESAKHYLNDAINHAWEINWHEGIGRAKYELAELLYAKKKTLSESEINLREASSIFKRIGVSKWIGKAETLLAMMHKEK